MRTLPSIAVNPGTVLTWTGKSGSKYPTYIHPIGVNYLAVPGVYIFCRQAADGNWYAVYVGQTHDFSRRIANELAHHHCWPRTVRAGATHICTMRVADGEAMRLAIESDLIQGTGAPVNRT